MNAYREVLELPAITVRKCRSCKWPVSGCRCRMHAGLITALLASLLGLGVIPACSVVPVFTKATGSAAVVVSGAYRALDKYDADKMAEIQVLARGGHPAAAQAALDAYLPKYKAARTVVDSASFAIETAVASLPAIRLGTSSSKRDALQWIGVLTKAAADVVAACAGIGLKLPGVM